MRAAGNPQRLMPALAVIASVTASVTVLVAGFVLATGLTGDGQASPRPGSPEPVVRAAPASAGVTVAEDLVRQGEPWFEDGELAGYSMQAEFLISPGRDQATVDGVLAAVPRLQAIDEFGAEIDLDDPRYGDRWTPGWVAAFQTSEGVALLIDTDGELPLVQGEALVAVLVEELTAHGATARIDTLPADLELEEQITP